jgi:hypothetical protein
MRATIVTGVLLVLCVAAATAGADPATAKKHNNAGMKLYAKGDYEGAQQLFEKAIEEDPAFVKAHYNRASMAALQQDLDVMIAEFVWLKGATDPDAERVLAKAKTDTDFMGVSLVDDARIVMRLPLLEDTPLDQIVLAYGGWWSGVDEGMMQGWIEMQFLPRGKVKGRDHSGESGSWYPWSGTWKVKDRTITITIGKKTKIAYVLQECADASGLKGAHCLKRDDGGAWVTPGKHTDE